MNGWMACDFASSTTVFRSYMDDGWVIMKGCVQCNPFTMEKIPAGLESGTARSAGLCLAFFIGASKSINAVIDSRVLAIISAIAPQIYNSNMKLTFSQLSAM